MTNPAELIETGLANGLVHPGDGKTGALAAALSIFRTSAIPQEMAQEFAEQAGLPDPNIAKLTAEAIMHLLAENGLTVIAQADIDQLHTAAAATETHRHKNVRLGCTCGGDLIAGNFAGYGTDSPTVNGPAFIKAVSRLNPDCSTKHAVVD